MLINLRDNILLGDASITAKELKENKVTVLLILGGVPVKFGRAMVTTFVVELYVDRVNKPHIKDIACHIPKYMTQSGEVVAIVSKTGMVRAAFVAARAICEIEERSLYEVLIEMKKLIPKLEVGKAYL